ncbi:MAG: DUF4129 domain-containing protein [Acidobacteriia bacterium]|nr:DUF4129 domain-containing protein [Terriglobia bacterium]
MPAPALQETGNSISLAEYRQHLAGIAGQIESLQEHPEQASGIASSIPDNEKVVADGRQFVVHNRDLKNDLALLVTADPVKRATLLPRVRKYVQSLIAEAAAYDKSASDRQQAHDKLDAILSRREFETVQGLSLMDRLKARVFRWLSRILSGIHLSGGRFDVVQVLVYGVALSALGALLVWTIMRLVKPDEKVPVREIIPFSPSARGWRSWLAEAQSLGQHQDWRNAIHLAYWAGIAFLEEHGAWKPNRARTPREYLRLVGAWTPQHPPLVALTRKFETVWYGDRPAGETDFRETLGELERLGCR